AVRQRLALADPTNAGWQRNLAGSLKRQAFVAAQLGEASEAAEYLRQCHTALQGMRNRGMQLDPELAAGLGQLNQAAASNYAGIVEAAASSTGGSPARPVPTVSIPDPLAQPRREITLAELRESAARCSQRGLWEAASDLLGQLLVRGEPLAEVAPKLITCLVNAHEDLIPADAAKIEDLLRQLEAAGHVALATQLRQQHASKLAPPKKPWWKLW
ncbi:MAG: hypothetical protein WCK27_32865, partial [Verrucomicrobiota bacterium]